MTHPDIHRIASLALHPPRGRSPDDVILRELRRAGAPPEQCTLGWGRHSLYARTVSAWIALGGHQMAARRSQGERERVRDAGRRQWVRFPDAERRQWARLFWAAYDAGIGQHAIAREQGLPRGRVEYRSRALGFVRESVPGRHPEFWASRGPCVECLRVREAEELDAEHRCAHCALAVVAA